MTWNIMLKAMISESNLSKEIWKNRIENDLSRKHVKPPWIAGALRYQFGEILQLLKVVIKTSSKNWTSLLINSQIYIPFHLKLCYKTLYNPLSSSPIFHHFSHILIGESFPYLYKNMRSYLINESPWISPSISRVTIKIGNDKTHVFLEFQYK